MSDKGDHLAEPMTTRGTVELHDLSALTVRTSAVEGDIREIKTGMAALSLEMRNSFSTLAASIADRQKTPWASIFAGAAVLVSLLGFIGSLALAPLVADDTFFKGHIVTREEHDYREKSIADRLAEIQRQMTVAELNINNLEKDKIDASSFNTQHNDLKTLIDRERDDTRRRLDGITSRLNRIEDLYIKSSPPR